MQILTQEDWNYVLYLAMRYTSHWAAIYFIALMTFGNYVLFNLLVAILVEGFSDDEVNVSSKDSESSRNHQSLDNFPVETAREDGTEEHVVSASSSVLVRTNPTTGNGPPEVPIIMRTVATPISVADPDIITLFAQDRLLRLPKRFSRPITTASSSIAENSAAALYELAEERTEEEKNFDFTRYRCAQSERS